MIDTEDNSMDVRGFAHLKPGDRAIRLLAGVIRHPVEVIAVEGPLLYAIPVSQPGEHPAMAEIVAGFPRTKEAGWCFRRDSGDEVDERFRWDGITLTGSQLVHQEL